MSVFEKMNLAIFVHTDTHTHMRTPGMCLPGFATLLNVQSKHDGSLPQPSSTSFYSLKLKNQTLWNEPGSLC